MICITKEEVVNSKGSAVYAESAKVNLVNDKTNVLRAACQARRKDVLSGQAKFT